MPLLPGAAQVGDPVAVLPVAYHLLWRRELACDMSVLLGSSLDGMAGPGRGRAVTAQAGPPGLIRAGDRVVIDGRPRVVLGASGTADPVR